MGNSFDLTPATSPTSGLLRFVAVKAGELVTLEDLPQLSSPTGAYGLLRMDNGDVLVADGEEFTLVGDALYEYLIADPEAGLTYRYYIEAVIDGVTYYLPRTTAYVQSAMLAIGRYTSSDKIEKAFGVDNVHKWLGIDDNDEPADYALRAYGFIAAAEAEIDDLLRGVCDVPFTTVPDLITTIATNLAGVRFYEARGVVDTNPETGQVQHRLQFQAKWVDKQIGRIKAGQIKFSTDSVTRHPGVITD